MIKIFNVISLFLLITSNSFAENKSKGWNYLQERLIEYGVPANNVKQVFNDLRFPKFTPIPFQVKPMESKASYEHFYKSKYVELANEMLNLHKESFNSAEKFFKVDKYIIAAILLIETQYGNYTGSQITFYRLSRIASVKEADNLEYNFNRLKFKDENISYSEMLNRANYLEDTFLPEVVALFDFSNNQNIDILSVKGSNAGAFGIPQFLPRSYLKFSIDGNKNQEISLFEINDAIASTANFLAYYSWHNNLSNLEKEAVIWNYNRSKAYTSSVVEIANILRLKQTNSL